MANQTDDQAKLGQGKDVSGDDKKAQIGAGADISPGGGTPAAQPQIDPEKLQEFMTKYKVSSVDDVVNLIADRDRKITELSTKSKLSNYPTSIQPPVLPKREPPKVNIELPEDVSDLLDDRQKLVNFATSLVDKAKDAAKVEIQGEMDDQRMMTMYNEANRLIALDPEKWHRLKGTMRGLLEQYPNARLTDIYEEADRQFTENKKQAINEIRRELGLEGLNPADIRNLMGKTNTAPIHDTGGGVGGGAGAGLNIKRPDQMTREEREALVKESIFGEIASVLRED